MIYESKLNEMTMWNHESGSECGANVHVAQSDLVDVVPEFRLAFPEVFAGIFDQILKGMALELKNISIDFWDWESSFLFGNLLKNRP